MTALVITENRHSFGFVVSEDEPGRRSRDEVTLLQQTYDTPPDFSQAGTVLGVYGPTTGAPVYAATGGNTGNFTCGTVTESAGAIVGAYRGEFVAPTVYNLFDPNNDFVGEGHTGAAFSGGGVGFTLTAGGTAAIAGDSFTQTVGANANAGKYNPVSLTATDGTQNAAAILGNTIDASGGNTKVTVIARDAEVNGGELIYPPGASASQIAALNAQLQALGIIVR
jgi:hypothetical protein